MWRRYKWTMTLNKDIVVELKESVLQSGKIKMYICKLTEWPSLKWKPENMWYKDQYMDHMIHQKPIGGIFYIFVHITLMLSFFLFLKCVCMCVFISANMHVGRQTHTLRYVCMHVSTYILVCMYLLQIIYNGEGSLWLRYFGGFFLVTPKACFSHLTSRLS